MKSLLVTLFAVLACIAECKKQSKRPHGHSKKIPKKAKSPLPKSAPKSSPKKPADPTRPPIIGIARTPSKLKKAMAFIESQEPIKKSGSRRIESLLADKDEAKKARPFSPDHYVKVRMEKLKAEAKEEQNDDLGNEKNGNLKTDESLTKALNQSDDELDCCGCNNASTLNVGYIPIIAAAIISFLI